jgi:hypothetical protein
MSATAVCLHAVTDKVESIRQPHPIKKLFPDSIPMELIAGGMAEHFSTGGRNRVMCR